jgi:methionine-S-sulfoxide reductase
MRKIWLAGGCFWGVEAYFQQLKGVVNTMVGYGQGIAENPTYQQVCSGATGHTEICEVTYAETSLSLTKILEHFFRIIDPTTLNQQGPDRGSQYRSGIYSNDEADLLIIHDYIQRLQQNVAKPIVVEAELLQTFYPAEEYHQNYLRKNPHGYCHVDMGLAKPNERV